MEMASSDQREAMARRGMEAFNAGDAAGMLAALSGDVEVYASPEMINAGRYSGHDGFMSWLTAWTEAWEEITAEVTETIAVGEQHIVTAIHQEGLGRDGIRLSMELAFLFGLGDDGLCTYLAMVPTPEEAIEIAREREGLS
jgi:ketosteroid isomerase-like protein